MLLFEIVGTHQPNFLAARTIGDEGQPRAILRERRRLAAIDAQLPEGRSAYLRPVGRETPTKRRRDAVAGSIGERVYRQVHAVAICYKGGKGAEARGHKVQ